MNIARICGVNAICDNGNLSHGFFCYELRTADLDKGEPRDAFYGVTWEELEA